MTIYRDDLERVYALIEKPEAWAIGWFAFDQYGDEVGPIDARACKWCLEGALCKVMGLHATSDDGWKVRNELDAVLQIEAAAGFNDSHTHAEVLALLRSAIERAPVRP